MKYEWKKTIFTPKDFEGAGHYIVREGSQKLIHPHILDTGYLSTIMKKVGWSLMTNKRTAKSSVYCLIDMSDGLVYTGYFAFKDDKDNKEFIEFSGETNKEALAKLCEYLNNNPYGDTYRFATNEEVVRVVMHQRGYRTKD